jgi:hypothetical protein
MENLNCEDLMVNDWVMNTHNQKPERVREILERMVMLDYNDLYEYDEIEPIPLTPEILEKNWFLANRHVYPYPYYEYEVKESKVKVGFAFPQVNKTSYKNPWVCIDMESVYIEHLPCIFVHQLQHALRLAGVEKEITI